jgi:hypothetical protein
VVVGLASGVMELEDLTSDLDTPLVGVCLVRVAVLRRPSKSRSLELALVDDRVVAGREHVAVEAARKGLVGEHARRPPSVGLRLLVEQRYTEDMINVAVGVHGGVERVLPP